MNMALAHRVYLPWYGGNYRQAAAHCGNLAEPSPDLMFSTQHTTTARWPSAHNRWAFTQVSPPPSIGCLIDHHFVI
jgi:hypothetical protein